MAGIKRTAADSHFSDCVRERAGWRCESCAKYYPENFRSGIECAHIISRKNKRVRHDPDNALALCTFCHMHYTGNPLEFSEFVAELKGEDVINSLRERALETVTYNKVYRDMVSKHYLKEKRAMAEARKAGHSGWLDFNAFKEPLK